MKFIDLTGQPFGKLTALYPIKHPNRANRHYLWKCKCECGNEKDIQGAHLRNGHTKSCGCSWYTYGESHKSWKGHKEISKRFFYSIEQNAKVRKIQFDVTMFQLWDLFIKQDRKCALTGLPLNFSANHNKIKGNASLDRIDSTKGYMIDNIQWVHSSINQMKWNMPQEDFFQMCEAVCNYRQQNKI